MNVLMLGAGQLARMMALAAKPLNIEVRAYDVGSEQVINPLANEQVYGDLASGIAHADAITAEFEHIDHDVLALCEASGKLKPSSQAIKIGGDRRLEKALLAQSQADNAEHVIVEDEQGFQQALEHLSLPIILKSALAGYDGKGQWRLKSNEQAAQVWTEVDEFFAGSKSLVKQGIVAEQMVPFDREVSLVGVRGVNGDVKVYPLTENHHTDGVLSVSLALTGEEELQKQAQQVFTNLTNAMDYVGILAIEFFQVGNKLLVNEIAPRVHNSGHWTQQGSDTCQFENHIRAVCGLPLGGTELLRPTAMINILGEDQVSNEVLAIQGVSVHWYGKTKRAGRKMGHINVSGESHAQLQQRLQAVADLLPESAFSDIKAYIGNLT
ncbi:5-(carboxyamino)imidazole ribonucleotide synthase [Psychrobium sp. 1_MG-2023]|uniref:5-(carboxyamino)imidazole ribonucleotide synthase n=1 Tax=Psychrobium sp. 1_MG-2023 TaxID=3062624 RepID=UPI000C346EDF|nr:5-(carboxyamino)imidazole ribonucleotide synthase [Psychrobium sp. 1_MG-2023]MDP2561101.1 5-(carboxyamino)imidazole ribonucleotide synthase [Psychrobium sp. 1_MG-2023]PKF58389.1 5-(carboxyamino)imidazole ribonucleotide synthase [Alteromonadales bacterium alter-6D02]